MASELVLAQAARSVTARKRIRDALVLTPCMEARAPLPENTGLFFKAENYQRTGSFKMRGALSRLTSLPTDMPIITASSGNHGIACATAAKVTGHDLTVVLPVNVAKAKLEKIKAYGVNVILEGADPGLSELHAQKLAESGEYRYVSPYNDEWVAAGQGTIGLELLEQLPRVDNVFISMGGGGLISGVGSVMKAFSPETRMIGVAADHTDCLAQSIKAGKILETEHLETLADGCSGGVDEDSITLPLAMEVVDEVIHCSEEEIADALCELAWSEKMLVEGAAAISLAAFRKHEEKFAGQVNVVVLCGSNFDRDVILPVISKA